MPVVPTTTSSVALVNQRWQNLLGWTLIDFSDSTSMDEPFIKDVRDFQSNIGITPDGVVGPATYAARLRQRLVDLKSAAVLAHANNGFVAIVSHHAVIKGTLLWLEDIVDPPDAGERWERSRAAIDKLIRTEAGLNWTWEPPYQKDGDYEWCGTMPAMAFASFLSVATRQKYFSSTYRLDRFFRELPVSDEPPPFVSGTIKRLHVEFDEHSGPADLDAVGPHPGDICLVGGVASGFGAHITLLESWDGKVMHTLECNAAGPGPRGNEREGVCRRTRPVGLKAGDPKKRKHLRRLLRFAPTDFVLPAS